MIQKMTCAGPCFAATPTHGRPTMKRDLGEGEIGEAELAHERGAARFDRSFFAEEVRLMPHTTGVV
jgi:hypothetical protein